MALTMSRTPPKTLARRLRVLVRKFELAVAANEFAGGEDPDNADEIRRDYRVTRRHLYDEINRLETGGN